MAKMFDLGMKYPKAMVESGPIKPNEISYPSLYLEKIPKELSGKDVGSVCRIEIIAKVVNKSMHEDRKKETKTMGLEVHKMRYVESGDKLTKEEYLEMPQDERDRYDSKRINEK